MKKINYILSFAFLLMLFACATEEFEPVVNIGNAPVLNVPAASVVLEEANAGQSIGAFSWTKADFGFPAATTYILEMDKAGNNFNNAFTMATTNETQVAFTAGEFNNKMLTFGLPGDWTSEVEFRVLATVSQFVDTVVSAPAPMTVTTYDVIVNYPKLYVPGSYQGWDPSNEKTVVYSVKSNDRYQGYFWFPDEVNEFKFTKVPAWEEPNTIGDPDPAGQSGTLQIGNWGGNNIKVTTGAGYYLIKADLIAKTYSATKTEWGLIGSATPGGWDSDQNMTYDIDNGVWTITLDLVAGDIKFRANDDWALNYGDDGPDGKLEQDGANIAIATAGNYTITMNLEAALYTYSIVKN